jgi:lysophospholipase L1-like esterase
MPAHQLLNYNMHVLLNPSTIPTRHFFPLALLLIGISGCDGGGGSAPLFNVPPVASNSCNAISDGSFSVVVPLPASDSNGNNTIASYTIDTLPANGGISGCTTVPCIQQCATVAQCASFTYSPNQISNLRGMDKFNFHVTDAGGLASSMATVWILNNGKVRIMPLGDSITTGDFSLPGNDLDTEQVGYRRKLYLDLEGMSPNRINFVGSQSDGLLDHDKDNEGHGGACATGPCTPPFETIDSKVTIWLDSNPADIVLLHVGINDINQRGDTSSTGVNNILNAIDTWEAANYPVTVFLAKIIDDVPMYQAELPVTTYNSNLDALFAARPNDRLIMVDMHDGAGISYGSGSPGPDMWDNVHPNLSGYEKMAAKWLTDMTDPANVGTKYLGIPQCP